MASRFPALTSTARCRPCFRDCQWNTDCDYPGPETTCTTCAHWPDLSHWRRRQYPGDLACSSDPAQSTLWIHLRQYVLVHSTVLVALCGSIHSAHTRGNY